MTSKQKVVKLSVHKNKMEERVRRDITDFLLSTTKAFASGKRVEAFALVVETPEGLATVIETGVQDPDIFEWNTDKALKEFFNALREMGAEEAID